MKFILVKISNFQIVIYKMLYAIPVTSHDKYNAILVVSFSIKSLQNHSNYCDKQSVSINKTKETFQISVQLGNKRTVIEKLMCNVLLC